MADIPEHELEETRAALAPTLEATAAILPLVAKPQKKRFDPKLNERWITCCQRLAKAWSNRHEAAGADSIRSAIFALYDTAIETADTDCLHLGEALASAADRLDSPPLPPQIIAAMTAAIECLMEADGLEHSAFPQRAAHFAKRLDACATATGNERSNLIDHLFIDEADEQIQTMYDALAALPPDAYVLSTEVLKLAQQAELLEIWGVMQLARQLSETINREAAHLDDPPVRDSLERQLKDLSAAIAAIDP